MTITELIKELSEFRGYMEVTNESGKTIENIELIFPKNMEENHTIKLMFSE